MAVGLPASVILPWVFRDEEVILCLGVSEWRLPPG